MGTVRDQKAYNPTTVSLGWGKGWPTWEHFTPQIHEVYSALMNQPQTNQNSNIEYIPFSLFIPTGTQSVFSQDKQNKIKIEKLNNRWGIYPH